MKSRWAWVLMAGIGCGSTHPVPADDLDTIELAPAPGWPPSVEVRSVPRAFRTSVTSL